MTLEEYIEERRKIVANMTLAQARDLIAKSLSHSDMEIEFDKAVWMLLNCADEKINGGWIPVSERLPEEDGGYLVTVKRGYVTTALWVGNAENWKEVTAWMPLTKPYKSESENT